jgi:molybdenum cofactor guanylyltransferase
MTDDSIIQLNNFSVAILAGGQSRRLGQDKALVQVGGVPMLRRIIERVAKLNPAYMVIITPRPAAYYDETLAGLDLPCSIDFTHDAFPDRGALGGLYTAVYHNTNLVLACDMPFINMALLKYMLTIFRQTMQPQSDEAKITLAVMPRVDRTLQPFHSIYLGNTLATLMASIVREYKHPRVTQFFENIIANEDDICGIHCLDEPEWRQFDEHGYSFWNINTPEDLARAQQLAEAHPEL